MPVSGKDTKVEEQGTNKDAFAVSFTNGALQQLEELTSFFDKKNKTETIELAVSILEMLKNNDKKKDKETVKE